MTKKIVKIIIKQCLGLKKGEHVLIVCDDQLQMLAQTFYKTLQQEAIETVLLRISKRKMHGEEPPREVASALKATDIAILLTSISLSHTQARKKATASGTRIASLPGITPEILGRSIVLNYSSLRKQVAKATRRLSKGKRVEVYTKRGTHLAMSIQGRKGFADDGLYVRPGAFGNLPAGEACIAPCEGTTNGCLVVDASAPLVGKLKRPITIIIKDGLVEGMPFPQRIASLIQPLGRPALNIAEFGIGLNPKARVTGNVLEDEKAKETAHLAIGANLSFGGKVSCPCHLDFVFLNPIVFIDGKRL